MVDCFYCPIQETEGFSFDVCRSCRYLTITRGDKFSVKCKKNNKGSTKGAFECAFLIDYIGKKAEVKILPEQPAK